MLERKLSPSQLQDRFIVRLPDGYRERIAATAKANGRSMNSELVATLEAAYPAPEPEAQLIAEIEGIFGRARNRKSQPDAVELFAALTRYAARSCLAEQGPLTVQIDQAPWEDRRRGAWGVHPASPGRSPKRLLVCSGMI